LKALIGIDTAGAYEPAVRLFGRLGFPTPEVTLLNVADIVLPYTSFGVVVSIEATNQFVEGLRQAGNHEIHAAQKTAEEYGLSSTGEVLSGPTVLTILDAADRINADLIALASTRKSALASLFLGSTSRSIVSASKHSVLVAKEGVATQGPIEIVLATDHSPYANSAIDRFLKLAPQNITNINVVTAYEVSDKEAELLHLNLPALDGHIDQFIEGKLREKSEELVGKLSQHGYNANYTLKQGNPNEVIPAEMTRTKAELLVLGAQGHGFIDRLFVGSVSFHQLAAEPYSVFIVRADG